MTRRTVAGLLAVIVALAVTVGMLIGGDDGPHGRMSAALPVTEEPEQPGARPAASSDPIHAMPFREEEDAESRPRRASGRDEGTLVVHVTWESTGTAAAGIRVFATPPGDRALGRDGVTADDGVARIEGVRAGSVVVVGDRGGLAQARVTRGMATRVDLTIPTGSDVQVRVVNQDGRPVAGARVWCSVDGDPGRGSDVGLTDAAGACVIKSVGSGHDLAAWAAGYGPSGLYRGVRDDVEIMLRTHHARIRGTIRGGDPAQPARVVASHAQVEPIKHGKATRYDAPPQTLDVGERFEFFAPVGMTVIEVHKPGFAPWSWHGNLADGEIKDLGVDLSAGGTVVATLHHERPAQIDCIVTNGMFRRRAKPDAEGRVVLENVPAGVVKVAARTMEGDAAKAEARLENGERVEFDLRFQTGRVISGVVVTPHGAATPSTWRVMAFPAPGTSRGKPLAVAEIQEGGRFRMANVTEQELVLAVTSVSTWLPVAVTGPLRAPASDVRIVVPADRMQLGEVTIAVADPDGSGAIGVYVRDFATGLEAACERRGNGIFELQQVARGTYAAYVVTDDLGVAEYPLVVTGAADRVELQAPQRGSIVIAAARRPRPRVTVRPVLASPSATLEKAAGTRSFRGGRTVRVLPGRYAVECGGRTRTIELSAGATVETQLD